MIYTEKTLVEVLDILRKRGYTEDFNLMEENLSYKTDGSLVRPEELVIDKTYRFSGFSDLDDEAILYAIHSKADGAKGVFVNGYGTYTDGRANAIIDRISVNDDGEDWTK